MAGYLHGVTRATNTSLVILPQSQLSLSFFFLFSFSLSVRSVTSRVQLFATHQALRSMRFFRQEYWSGLPFPPPQNLPDPGIEPTSLALAGGFFTTDPPGKPQRKNTLNHTCTHSCVSIFFCYVFLNPWFKVILLIPRITGFILAFNLSLFTIFLHK